jgi:putative transposase
VPDAPHSSALRRSRPPVTHVTFLVTTTTAGRQPLLAEPRPATLVADALQWLRREGRIWLHGYTIMPDHLHVVLTVLAPYTVDAIMHSLKSYAAKGINAARNTSGPVWASAYRESALRTPGQVRRALAYTRDNPTRAGLVAPPEVHAYTCVFEGRDDLLDPW